MCPVVFTKEELDMGILQLGCRKDYFDKELTECKDPARIKELVFFMQPLESLLNKLRTLRYDS